MEIMEFLFKVVVPLGKISQKFLGDPRFLFSLLLFCIEIVIFFIIIILLNSDK